MEKQEGCILVKAGNKMYRILLKEVLYITKDLRKICVFVVAGESYTFYGKFELIGPYLDARFCRCHNSYIVNLDMVKELWGDDFHLENGGSLPISHKRRAEVKRYYQKYLMGEI